MGKRVTLAGAAIPWLQCKLCARYEPVSFQHFKASVSSSPFSFSPPFLYPFTSLPHPSSFSLPFAPFSFPTSLPFFSPPFSLLRLLFFLLSPSHLFSSSIFVKLKIGACPLLANPDSCWPWGLKSETGSPPQCVPEQSCCSTQPLVCHPW